MFVDDNLTEDLPGIDYKTIKQRAARMEGYKQLKDIVANGIRISDDEADALLVGKTIQTRLYIDGDKFLNVELHVDKNSYNGWRIK